MKVKLSNSNQPSWKMVSVKSHLPKELNVLDELAHNLWWSWNQEAVELFDSIDHKLWHKCGKNPVELLSRVSYERLEELAADKVMLAAIEKVYKNFRAYMDVKPNAKRASVAYFCMEYGLNSVLKI